METIKIKKIWAGMEITEEYEILTYQIDEKGNNISGYPAICPFCKKSIKANSVAYDYKYDNRKGGNSFCAKSHLKNWLKINK